MRPPQPPGPAEGEERPRAEDFTRGALLTDARLTGDDLAARGWTVIRTTWEQLTALSALLSASRAAHVPLGTAARQVGVAPRERLLTAAMDYVAHNGAGDLSLRALAAALGTSHRMLIYHFGSREGLLIEVIRAVEAQQRAALEQMLSEEGAPEEIARRMWRRLADPSLWPNERLFFEVYAQALQGSPHARPLLEGIVDTWVEPLTRIAVAQGTPEAKARAEARLGVAVTRGLLLDLLATGDREGVDAAMERYIEAITPG